LARNRAVLAVSLAVPLAATLFTASCGNTTSTGRSPSFLILDSLEAASGANPKQFSSYLESDVVTDVTTQVGGQTEVVPTVYEDYGQVTLHMAMKDPTVTTPSEINSISLQRYHVDYNRSDGLNTQGVDVPYSFDGALSGTVTTSSTTFTFVLVRAQAKLEPPLMALRNGGGAIVISTLASVIFYGQDQAGNGVSVTGTISVNFADWADSSS
jgi:hypothetical protein